MFYSAGESFDARKHLFTFIYSAGTSEEKAEDGEDDEEGEVEGREGDEGGGRESGDQDSALPATRNR